MCGLSRRADARGTGVGGAQYYGALRNLIALLLLLPCACQGSTRAQWVRVTTPHFEMYTTASEKAGRDLALYFEQVRGFFLKASPLKAPATFPVRIIAFAGRDQYIPYATQVQSAAYYAPSARRDYIVMSDLSPESYKTAVHEYMHLVVRHSGLRIPLWLNEGWADVYSTLKPVKDGVAVGDLIPARMQSLAGGQWFDFNALTSVTTASSVYNESNRAGLFYGESWAFVHMLFLSPEYKDHFGKFVMALHRGSTAAEACQTAFGKPAAAVFDDLSKYLGRKKLVGAVFATTIAKGDTEAEVTKAPEFESRLVLADLQAAIGRAELARQEYDELQKLEPNNPELNLSLGFAYLMREDASKARDYFARSFGAGGKDPQMCLALGMLEIAAKQPPGQVIPILERAVQGRPDYQEAWLQLGVQRVAARQFVAGIEALMKVESVTPERASGVYFNLTYAYLETGDLAKARESGEIAKKWAKLPEQVARLGQMLKFIQARGKLVPPPRPGEVLRSVEGMVQGVDCGVTGNRLRLQAGERMLSLVLPEAGAVEFSSATATAFNLKCGAVAPFRVRVEYVPGSVMNQATAGVVRRVEY
jgi:Flp pilus assembly protein TadD